MKYLIPINLSTSTCTAVQFNLIDAPVSLGFIHSADDIDAVYFAYNDKGTTVRTKARCTSNLCYTTDSILPYTELHIIVNGVLVKYNWN